MTLIELMVGIVITGIATAAGYAAFSSIIENRERARLSTMEVQRAAATRNLISSWFVNATIVRDSGLALPLSFGTNANMNEPDDYVRFRTWGPTPLASQQTEVLMYIDRDPFTTEAGLVAEFTALNQPIDSTLMMVVSKKMEINPNVWGLEVWLLDPTTRQWMTQLDIGNANPLGILIQLHPAWRDELPPLLAIPFIYPLGNTR